MTVGKGLLRMTVGKGLLRMTTKGSASQNDGEERAPQNDGMGRAPISMLSGPTIGIPTVSIVMPNPPPLSFRTE